MQAGEYYEDYALPPRPLRWYRVWWLVYTHPSAATFDRIITDPGASVRRAFTWIFVTTVVLGAIELVLSWINFVAFLGDRALKILLPSLILVPVNGIITMIVLAIAALIWHVLARIFGGRGWFVEMIYALAAIAAPSMVLPILLTPLVLAPPVLLLPVEIALSIYPYVLIVLALKSIYRLGTLRSVVVALIPPLAIVGLVVVYLFATASQMDAIAQSIYATLQAYTPSAP